MYGSLNARDSLLLWFQSDDFENPTQNPTQHVAVMPRIDSQPENTAHEKRLVLPSNASSRNTMQAREVGDEGLYGTRI